MEALFRAGAWLAVVAATAACQQPRPDGVRDTQTPQSFPTSEEAIRKAKADFLEALRSGRDLNLGVDAATLERAQPGAFVSRVDLAWNKLLAADSAAPFDSLVAEERNTVVPFVADGGVVTIVEIARGGAGWRVVGLAGRDIALALDQVRRAAGDTAAAPITLYEVPNLQTRVYGVRRGDAQLLFTDWEGRSLREPTSAAALVPALKAAAVEFQRRYGDSLRTGRLVR